MNHLKMLAGPIIAFALLHIPCTSAEEQPTASFQEGLAALRVADEQKALIEKVAKLASEGKSDELLSLFAPVARKAAGETALLEYINEELIPFFSTYEHMDTYTNVVPSTFPDGSNGLFHFVYFVDKKESFRPFMVGILTQDGTPYVGVTAVDQCIKGGHVRTRGRCGG